MIVRLNTGGSVSGAVKYNEDKLKFGDATLLHTANYPSELLASKSKQYRADTLELYAAKNSRISKPCAHFALSFSPTETLSDELITKIGNEFMGKMGFKDQPYIQYRHGDTAHPHIHIVTVLVDGAGKKVSEDHIKRRCNEARKELEIKYNLVKAEDQKTIPTLSTSLPEDVVEYGKSETKKAIGNVIQTAFKDYSFSNLSEFDKFIRSYGVQMNVIESKGRPNHKGETDWKGLTFQITNGDKPVSPEVKASTFHFELSYKKLQEYFHDGAKKKDLHKEHLVTYIKESLMGFEQVSETDFKNALRERSIQVIDTGKNYLYVDHKKRTVYSESDLGKQYSRADITSELTAESKLREKKQLAPVEPELMPAERAALGKLVSKHFQQFKKDNDITFESQLIKQFPYQ